MKLLMVGGAGYVGGILRPVLEAHYECRYFDLRPVVGAEGRCVLGDVNDEDAVRRAVDQQEALLYLAMGSTEPGDHRGVNEIDPAFNVNVRGLYRVLFASLAVGVRRVCVASSLSVYRRYYAGGTNESSPPDSWSPYGLSKRLGEFLCQAAAQQYPDATLTVLRLILPKNDADWPRFRFDPQNAKQTYALGPRDTQRLFLSALALNRPGCHVVQTTGDITNQLLPNDRAHALLGWLPRNE